MKIKVIFYLASILFTTMCSLTSCKKSIEEIFSSNMYVRCNLDGEEYITQYRGFLDFWSPTPDFFYTFKNGEGYFRFCFYGESEKKDSAFPVFQVKFRLYLNEPLKIEKEYPVSVIPDFNLNIEDIDEAIDFYEERKQAYCVIESGIEPGWFSFGDGLIKFTQINNPEGAYKGKLHIKFSSLSDPWHDGEEIYLNGEFLIIDEKNVSLEI